MNRKKEKIFLQIIYLYLFIVSFMNKVDVANKSMRKHTTNGHKGDQVLVDQVVVEDDDE
jgi:hypothetical protein